jgi:hypothetical protein
MSRKLNKLMWYFVAGKVMSLSTVMALFNLLNNGELTLSLEKLLGWFLIEHIFEEYSFTAGKFFLINEDFRTLIKNLLIIARNLIFLAQALDPLEFLIINIVLFSIFLIYKNNSLKYAVQSIIFSMYVLILQSFLLVNLVLTWVLLKSLLISLASVSAILFYVNFLFLHVTFSSNKKKNYYVILIKFMFYVFLLILVLVFIGTVLVYMSKLPGNFVQEFLFQTLTPYFYLYYL